MKHLHRARTISRQAVASPLLDQVEGGDSVSPSNQLGREMPDIAITLANISSCDECHEGGKL